LIFKVLGRVRIRFWMLDKRYWMLWILNPFGQLHQVETSFVDFTQRRQVNKTPSSLRLCSLASWREIRLNTRPIVNC
jgi:hypothetical protein